MHVWVVDPRNYTPYYDYSLCKALGELGCRVQWLTRHYSYDRIENRDGLTIEYAFDLSLPAALNSDRLERSLVPLVYLPTLLGFVRRIQRDQPDILHVQWAPMPLVDWLLFRAVQNMSTRLVYTVHNILPHEQCRWHTRFYRKLYESADQLIVHSGATARRLCQLFGISENRVTAIVQGNVSDFAEVVSKQQARHTLELDSEAKVLLFFGIIRPYKGLQCLLKAVHRVRRAIPDVRLLIVGHVHRNDNWSRYFDLIEQFGLADVVTVHMTFVPHSQLGVYFGAADVVVLPYVSATDSAVLTTAYSFGRPVVTTHVGGLPEIVEEGQSGRLVPPNDCEALAEALVDLLSDSAQLERMGNFARHLADTRHAWPGIARATLEVYESLYRDAHVHGTENDGLHIKPPVD